MQLDVGKIYEGKVTRITKFGAFVEIEPGTTGMVHISEVANTFVNEIKDHLTEGQPVKVRVISVSDEGKISLSIKKASDNQTKQKSGGSGRRQDSGGNRQSGGGNRQNSGGSRQSGGGNRQGGGRRQDSGIQFGQENSPQTADAAFEDMLNKFKQSSDERMGDLKKVIDNKRRSPSRRK